MTLTATALGPEHTTQAFGPTFAPPVSAPIPTLGTSAMAALTVALVLLSLVALQRRAAHANAGDPARR